MRERSSPLRKNGSGKSGLRCFGLQRLFLRAGITAISETAKLAATAIEHPHEAVDGILRRRARVPARRRRPAPARRTPRPSWWRSRLRENCMVATAEPKVWIDTLFCSAVAASGGMQPKPMPIRNSSASNSQQRHAAARATPAPAPTAMASSRPTIGMRLVVLAPRQDRAGHAGADVERDREHQHAQARGRRRHADDVLQIDRQEDVQADDRRPSRRRWR